MNHYWTLGDDAILRQHYRDEGPSGIHAKYIPYRSENSIRHRATKLGLQSTKGRGAVTKLPDEDFKRLIAQIPRDTRDLTGRLCGDPLPGRSALDRHAGGTGA